MSLHLSQYEIGRLAWLLDDVAERLPRTDVGRERYCELRDFAAIAPEGEK